MPSMRGNSPKQISSNIRTLKKEPRKMSTGGALKVYSPIVIRKQRFQGTF